MLTVKSTINIASQTVPPIIPVVQGDTGRSILFTLADFTIPSGATATYYVQKPSGEAVYNNATISDNTVTVDLTAQSIAEVGDNYGQVRITLDDEVVTSFEFILHVASFRGVDATESTTEMNIFDKAVEQAAEEIEEAKDAALAEINDVLDNIVAEEFSESNSYVTGEYVIYDGALYRFTSDHDAAAWDASDVEAITVGESLEALDSAVSNLQEDLAAEYSATATYTEGDYCLYEGQLYICTTAWETAGAWDSDYWEAVTVGEELTDLKGDLNDVKTALTTYDDTSDVGTIVMKVIKITDSSTTMATVTSQMSAVNTAGDHVLFDVSALGAGMYLCTIYINQDYYRVADLVTGFESTGFFSSTDTLYDIIKSGSESSSLHYTLQWDQSSSQGTRLNAAASITTDTTNFGHFGAVNSSYNNPFDDIYPWSGRKLCNIDIDAYMALSSGDSITDCVTYWEGDSGFDYDDQYGVWVYTPSFFGRSYTIGNYRYFDVSSEQTQYNIYYKPSLSGRWHGCPVTLTIDSQSVICNLPTTGISYSNVTMANQHVQAQNYGGSLVDIYTLDASMLLYMVEYGIANVQNALGNGVSSLYRQSSDQFKAAATSSTVVQIEYNSTIAALAIAGAQFDIGTTNGAYNIARTYIVSAEQNASDSTILDVTLADAVTVTTDYYWSIHGLINVADEDIGSMSGYIGTNGKCNAYYRGEVLYANKWQYILGAYRQTGTGEIWIAEEDDVDDYNALDTSVHIDTGLALPSAPGYVLTMGMCDGLSFPPFCIATGSGPYGDYCYVPALSSGNTVLLFGGRATDGATCGWYGYWSLAASNSDWSIASRPHLKNP